MTYAIVILTLSARSKSASQPRTLPVSIDMLTSAVFYARKIQSAGDYSSAMDSSANSIVLYCGTALLLRLAARELER